LAEFVFRLPDLAEGLADAEIVEWKVAEGDHVELNQTLVEVFTEKVEVEIPSPRSGVVKALHGGPGDKVKVGDPLVTLELGDEPGVVGRVPSEEAQPRRIRLTPPPPRST
jgi:pyruvate/2-oxoglutarate dehydrogenase complex dihydrolipoamide acyltransferase (E2) component